ncbi:Uncharacterised protein [Mycobacterium tuberculosis]|uniref:Uncharacterized protein n=1 Tax=Mycobacterium tuberculosis TaxID=1773 RepID=A0A654U092_MYCTX|nr:Uncharacterised protein [Mycobacterium tuberculosis]CFS33852.1 Uncharacterised protein [Mycobacterium tuberculosis]CKP85279.1 Uncharacterised protein [Mycobacterium tuberculosis]
MLAGEAMNPFPWVYTVCRLIQSRWLSINRSGLSSRAATT